MNGHLHDGVLTAPNTQSWRLLPPLQGVLIRFGEGDCLAVKPHDAQSAADILATVNTRADKRRSLRQRSPAGMVGQPQAPAGAGQLAGAAAGVAVLS